MSTKENMMPIRVNEGRHPVSPERARQLLKIITDDNQQPIPTKDIEEGHSFKEVKEPKSILKKEIIDIHRKKTDSERIIKLIFTLIIIIFASPIIICDFYFGLNDESCVEETPDKLAINLQIYMVVSAAVSLFMVGLIILSGCNISTSNSESKNGCIICLLECISALSNIFHTIWNILGGIVFWGFAYKNNLCDKNVSTYLFVSLIIKYIINYVGLNNMFKKKEK
jgi:hypothetical protein